MLCRLGFIFFYFFLFTYFEYCFAFGNYAEFEVSKGSSIYKIVVKDCLSTPSVALKISKAIKSFANNEVLRVNSKVRVFFDDFGSIDKLYIINSASSSYAISREFGGNYIAKRAEDVLDKKLMKIECIANSDFASDKGFFLTAEKMSATHKAIMHFVKLNSGFVDLNKRFLPGDEFSLLFERYFDSAGNFLFDGKLIYGSVKNKIGENSFYLISNDIGEEFFVNNDGQLILKDGDKIFLHPLKRNALVTSKFGMRIHPVTKTRKMHNGTDFAANNGAKVYASMDCIVETRGFNEIYGNYIILNHNNGYKTLYAHLSFFDKKVKKGSFIKRGEVIGAVGKTGRATGYHLHYEIWKVSPSGIVTKLNPIKYIGKSYEEGLALAYKDKSVNMTEEDIAREKNSIDLMFAMAPSASFFG